MSAPQAHVSVLLTHLLSRLTGFSVFSQFLYWPIPSPGFLWSFSKLGNSMAKGGDMDVGENLCLLSTNSVCVYVCVSLCVCLHWTGNFVAQFQEWSSSGKPKLRNTGKNNSWFITFSKKKSVFAKSLLQLHTLGNTWRKSESESPSQFEDIKKCTSKNHN